MFIRRLAPFVIFALAVLVLLPCEARACSTFCLERKGSIVFGKNYDFGIGYGMLVVNKRGVAKTSLVTAPNRPAAWTSKYGSLTFNQFGREFPMGGMNEAGMAVELMWLDAARYPEADARPALGVLEWIQYQLDNYETAAQVVANAEKVRIASRTPLHYLIADANGGCATVEFLPDEKGAGKLVSRSGAALPVRALTNDTYDSSLAFARAKGTAAPPSGPGSLERFARLSAGLENRGLRNRGRTPISPVDEAFRLLASVATPDWTQWSIAWDLKERRVWYRTRVNPKVRSVALSSFDFSCGTPVRVADVDSGEPAFSDYAPAANLALIEKSYRGVDFLRDTPPSDFAAAASHPDRSRCARK